MIQILRSGYLETIGTNALFGASIIWCKDEGRKEHDELIG